MINFELLYSSNGKNSSTWCFQAKYKDCLILREVEIFKDGSKTKEFYKIIGCENKQFDTLQQLLSFVDKVENFYGEREV